ncbi:MAG: single-stranded DNA-binding protein [Oscillospiraceae bacterium]|nr:single-stranded DNA-binding protein [Ruminococcus sp.]MCD8344412.1 single-stranded DNA-binding protein [Oscillospiraceae bacterium]
MLNRVILMGRITRDLEIRQSQGGTAVLRFSIAVDRNFARQGEERQTDFFTCVAFGQRAEFINKYFRKGSMIAIEGQLRENNYEDRNQVKHYSVEVIVDGVSFTGEKASDRDNSGSSSYQSSYRQPTQQQPAYNEPASNPIAIGNMDDFEEILSDDGVPF